MYRARTMGDPNDTQTSTAKTNVMSPVLSLGLTVGVLVAGAMFLGDGKPKTENGTKRNKSKSKTKAKAKRNRKKRTSPAAKAQTSPAARPKRRKKAKKSIAGKVNSKIKKLGRKSKSRKARR
ncbi:MAG: hypothetical protein AMQ22_01083 [Candidatus Methanofastidiosum methylothiophilum]|uniref:Uncharacterized protein n=1 Tax=Candidatus Methanofastidiosum methylothiophilum TaxID=1705564 RepID=A0A150J475_9EURY|nr:MAG: hypothetical protein AMQ22_01083 [Candidatus Methanofastidiosum methylthiophilus]